MVGTRARVLMALLVAVLLVPALDSSAVALTAAEKQYARSAFKATNVNRVEHDLEKVNRAQVPAPAGDRPGQEDGEPRGDLPPGASAPW